MSIFSPFFPNKLFPETHQFTAEVKDAPAVPGEGKPRRSVLDINNPYMQYPYGITDLHQNFLQAVAKGRERPFLGHRPITDKVAGPFQWETYGEVCNRVKNLGSGLVHRGKKPDSMIGLFSINNPQWGNIKLAYLILVIAEHACYMMGLTTVPLYDTLGHEAVEYIVLHL